MPELTIIVPCYNVEKFLRKGLSTFVDSRFESLLEVIIVNDGSTDSTPVIAKEYADKFPGIFRLINKENGGHGSTINTGINAARGRYFRIVDGDDWVHTENLYLLLVKMRDLNEDLIVDVGREINMESGNTSLYKLPQSVVPDTVYTLSDLNKNTAVIYYIRMNTVSVKTDILRKNKISVLEHTFYVDYEFIVKMCCFCKTMIFLDIEIYQYLVGNINQSVSISSFVARYQQHERVVFAILNFLAENRIDSFLISEKVKRLIYMQYNILLIYTPNKREGKTKAREFRDKLKKFKTYFRSTGLRYYVLSILHTLGFNLDRFDRLKKILTKTHDRRWT